MSRHSPSLAARSSRCDHLIMKGAVLFVALTSINAAYEGFHDLDQSSEVVDSSQQEEGAAANHEARLIGLESVPDTRQSREPKSKNIINRFCQIITRQVMNRFHLHQLRMPIFSFQRIHNSNPGSIASNDNKVSLANMNNMKKIGALCPPKNNDSDDASPVDDESLVVCEPDAASANTITVGDCRVSDDTLYQNPIEDDDEIQAGMIVYVLPSSDNHFNEADIIPEENDVPISMASFHDEGDDESESRCVAEMDKRYDKNEEVVQYALIRREFNELGIVDVHRKDFAYKPVAVGKPNHFYTDNWSGAEYNGHDTETTSDAVELLSTYDPGYSSSESNIDSDQQLSFRWWSWIDHFNQFFRQGYNNDDGADMIPGAFIGGSQGNSQSAYEGNLYEEEGHRAFAGGSHGEIWRAHRRCPSKTTDCDDKKEYIVKRLKIELGYPVLEAGLREVYFGELLGREAEASNLVTSYVDHFFREGKKGQIELWIVFENAGPSLRSYLYTPVVDADGGEFFSYYLRHLCRMLILFHDQVLPCYNTRHFGEDFVRALEKEVMMLILL